VAGGAIGIRRGGPADVPVILALADEAVRWLVAAGRSAQWGSRPWSCRADTVRRVDRQAREDRNWIAVVGDRPAGVLALTGRAPGYVRPATEPELYVSLLITGRRFAGRGLGATLLAHARAEAERAGVRQVRLDCYAGGDRRLVGYYRRHGFTEAEPITVGDWPGQVLVADLPVRPDERDRPP
jgi:GNAT superfamily N-acetyltransferase